MENTELVEQDKPITTKQEAQTTKAKQSEMRRRMAAFSDCC